MKAIINLMDQSIEELESILSKECLIEQNRKMREAILHFINLDRLSKYDEKLLHATYEDTLQIFKNSLAD